MDFAEEECGAVRYLLSVDSRYPGIRSLFFLLAVYVWISVTDSDLRKYRESQWFSWLLGDEGIAGARNKERPADCEFFGNNATCFLHSIKWQDSVFEPSLSNRSTPSHLYAHAPNLSPCISEIRTSDLAN